MFFGSKVEKNIKTGGCINPGVLSGGKSFQARKLFSQAQRIFKEASPKKLCSLVECKTYGPSDVLAIIPEATSEQLATLTRENLWFLFMELGGFDVPGASLLIYFNEFSFLVGSTVLI